jgi:cellulose synthase/poly-beta-1,6-N-acetylglucosamine synthase-like glycosyltransferase
MIPALNEERVLEGTVRRLLAMPYPGRLEVLIIDDHSRDRTPEIASRLEADHENVYTLTRNAERSRRGKGDALNHGFAYLCYRFPKRDRSRWIIGVFDADGRAVESDLLTEVGRSFLDPSVAAVQCGVRIRNRNHLLAAFQDVEFATFSYITQTVRDRTSGAVALGGNGQFIRAAALERLKDEDGCCWSERALTEDLDIGTRLHLRGSRIRFIDRWVEQEGIESLRALLVQRHRWAWGTLQVFLRHFLSGRLLRAPMPLVRKLDLHYYLSFWVVPFVVISSFALSLLHVLGVLTISNDYSTAFLLANSFGFVPLIVLGLVQARVPLRKMLYLVPLAVLYTYHWIPVLLSAWVCVLARRQPRWVKTGRYERASARAEVPTISMKERVK